MERPMNQKDYALYCGLCQLRQPKVFEIMVSFLSQHGYSRTLRVTKDYLYAEGDIPIALAAHADTVFSEPPDGNAFFYDREKNVIWNPYGMGADDRAGIFLIIKIIKAGFRPHIIITNGEEIGGIGAQKLATERCPFKDLRYIVQLDRRGDRDCVFYQNKNYAFMDYIEDYGFETEIGSFTDISFLCPAWNVSGVNLSVGYENEHTPFEMLFVDSLYRTLGKVKHMLNESQNAPYFDYKKWKGRQKRHGRNTKAI